MGRTHHRFVISDRLWQRIAPLLPGKATDRGLTVRDNRLFLEVVFWRRGTGVPWRDPYPGFGKWNSQFRPFRRWANSGVLQRLFQALSGHPDLESCSRQRHCLSSPEGFWRNRGTQYQSIGRSRGGLTTKMMALVDGLGTLIGFLLLPGQTHHSKGVTPLLKTVPFGALLVDKAFDTNGLLTALNARGAIAGTPPKASRKHQRALR